MMIYANGKQEAGEGGVDPWITVLDLPDPVGDDYGPGTYLYPTHPQFEPYQGIFDIEHFKVEGREGEVRFSVTFGQVPDPWHGPFGFSHQLIEIYLDHRRGGERYTFYNGANVVFSPKASWDTFIKVSGFGLYLFDAADSREANPEQYAAGRVQVLADRKTIEIWLPMEEWITLEELTDASFYLLVGGQDGFGPDHFRVVKKEVSEWYFGGGDGSGYGPNVLDIVTPPGRSQKKILGSYDPKNRIRSVIEPVHKPNPVRTGLVYLIAVVIGLALWYGWRKREGFFKGNP